MIFNRLSRNGLFGIVLLVSATATGRGGADEPGDGNVIGMFPRDFLIGAGSATPAPSVPRSNRVALFRIAPAFLTDPIGLDSDDPSTGDPAPTPEADDGWNWLQVAFGNDNPFLDLRRRGDPGGVGYYRVQSQIQLFDSPTTVCALNLKAVTPAGREVNGVAGGPTFVSPAVSFFQSLDENFALQAFVSKNMRLDTPLRGSVLDAVECGMSIQRPLLDGPCGSGRLYMFVEALGRYHYDTTTDQAAVLEMVPGVHWRMNESWWVSGGWTVPVSARTETGRWQITCWMHF